MSTRPSAAVISVSAALACLGAVSLAGCGGPAEPEFDPYPLVDVWAWPKAPGAKGDRYVVLQGNSSLCDVTVRGPEDADFAPGEWKVADGNLTLTRKLLSGAKEVDTYGVVSVQTGSLRLSQTSAEGATQQIALVHSKDYSSCADIQTRFGFKLKIR